MKKENQIADFPKEVIDLMLMEQVAQGNPKDITVFERNNYANIYTGGFKWEDTKARYYLWKDAILKQNYQPLIDAYGVKPIPKEGEMTAEEFIKTWDGISEDDRHATFYKWDTMLKFAEDYHKALTTPDVSDKGMGFCIEDSDNCPEYMGTVTGCQGCEYWK
ncbi:MAG: hypothetical protein OEY89_01365 [Gammaproteobacteria bacterium]|nr:hypothetical protein [Gammaproteobacteria bacterium]